MRNEMKKKNRVTEIYFNEQDNVMYGKTYNTKLKKQLRQLVVDYPEQCKIFVDADTDMIEFEINKNRLTFQINPELSADRKRRLSAEAEEASIKDWEAVNDLEPLLSENYYDCLSFFIANKFVYESDWTSYGNAREYSLCKPIGKLFFDTDFKDNEVFKLVKEKYTNKLPF